MTRVERLAALLEEPLLVAGPPYVLGGQANVRYLTGLQSSNAAVLVEPGGTATLYTDFRYASRARTLEGVEVVETARGLIPASASCSRAGASGSRSSTSRTRLPGTRRRGRRCRTRRGLVESLRAVKDARRSRRMRRRGALSDEVFAALAKERFSGRSERELAWWIERSFREGGAQGVSFEAVVGRARRPHRRTPCPVTPDRARRARRRRRRLPPRRLLLGLHAHVRRRGDLRAAQEVYALCLEAQLAGLDAVAPGVHGRDADAASRSPSRRRPRLGLRARDGARRRPADPRGADAASRVDGRARSGKRRLGRAGDLPPRRERGVRIEDLVLVTDGRQRAPDAVHEGCTVGRAR